MPAHPLNKPRVLPHIKPGELERPPLRYYDDLGRPITYEESIALTTARAEKRRKDKIETQMARWGAVMTPFKIEFDGEPAIARGGKVPKGGCSLVCGCEKKKKFTSQLGNLERFYRENETDGTAKCTQCAKTKHADRLAEVVKEHGGTLDSPYVNAHVKVKVTCENGHQFESAPMNMVRPKNPTWCPTCPSEKPRLRMAEILASYGCELVEYDVYHDDGKRDHNTKIIRNHADEEVPRSLASIYRNPVAFGEAPWQVREFFDEANKLVYVLIGDLPPLMPSGIIDILECRDPENMPVYVDGEARYRMSLAQANQLAKECIEFHDTEESDYKCVNVLHNPAWIEPGVYTWGTFGNFAGTLDLNIDEDDLEGDNA